jgi:hypothetical protein
MVVWLLAGLIGVAAPAVAAAGQGAAHSDSTGTIVGVVTMKDGGLPLGYSVASVPSLGRERFSDDHGVFILGELPAGQVQLRVRHLGYSPADLAVVVHAGRSDTVHVELTHIAVRLTAMQVHAYPPCAKPGVPARSADSAFFTVFEQLRQNADQFRLLSNTYPFVFTTERLSTLTMSNGDTKIDGVDTISVESKAGWVYKPGGVLTNDRQQLGGRGSMFMYIPTLLHFADQTFLDNHCFYNGGLESLDGTELLRVDFTAAERIREPDVDGSIYLDPTSFQIRRSILRLNKIPRGMSGLREVEAVTYFGELFPSIPVISGVTSVNRLVPGTARGVTVTEAHEQQRLLRVHFLKGLPGEDVKKP